MGIKQGFYLVLEGIDGCGKTRMATAIVHALKLRSNKAIIHLREPTYSNNGKAAREILMSNPDGLTPRQEEQTAELILLDRMENISNVVEHLRNDCIIIQERNALTAIAYNKCSDYHIVNKINKLALKPDVLVFLDTSVEVAMNRLIASGHKLDAYENKERMTENRDRYLDLEDDYIDLVLPNNDLGDFELALETIVKMILLK